MPTQANIYQGLVEKRDLLDFSQNFAVKRNYLGSTLFPDRKTQYIEAEYYRLAKNGNLPMIAQVHAFDTEAVIGSRIPLEKRSIEKLLIKEKINQTESIRQYTRGMQMDNVREYVFDDIARTAEKVVTRVEKAKMDAIAKGKFVISENGLDFAVDYGIPSENFVKSAWDEESDILGDIIKWADIAKDAGATPNRAITTHKVVSRILRNKTIQRQLFGSADMGRLPTLDEANALFLAHAGVTVVENDAKYATFGEGEDEGRLVQNRFFPEDAFVMTSVGANGSIGQGLWGVTPEEEGAASGAYDERRQEQFVTVVQWSSPDPVAVWTKASGLFVPVIPNPYGHIIADVSAGEANAAASGKDEGAQPGTEG